ncbi:nuclear transport factor 2 family protein [Leptospira mayottensis]|uniref:nuclear transport factor 2 family protein n=1 Tax=Leptospira mayottensis TaxID=1137606 RepID=UPI0002BFB870|nr:nuclear transport factor 2 family protein [Leptospira mayottensis]AXR60115.1 nuclear transport factor 2 family protein [Leptospira mayottensis]AXR67669.1 nuclear transport factor 2 family protein [Leptospira mayottensis]AZQ03464.1 nuclear transport factor 2 family protein [Leptospira mayottensis 200901116]TGN01916.1 nuclear transport factor 2 family protein [Leptospira mayottensis]
MKSAAEVTKEFYEAFQKKDAAKMGLLYSDSVIFNDPVFSDLNATEARGMWQMLVARGKDLELKFGEIQSDGNTGKVTWEATYTFSKTGKKVHNVIRAELVCKDGKIVKHTDRFGFYRWSRQALGLPGLFLGFLPFLRNKVRTEARKNLDLHLKRQK